MLLNSVIIILREILEASLIFSIFLGFLFKLQLPRGWVVVAFVAGLILSGIYASHIELVTTWFDGVGQEVVDALMHFSVFVLLVILVIALPRYQLARWRSILLLTVVASIMLSTVSEGAEIIIYISGFAAADQLFRSAIFGGLIGAGLGISVGVFFYYLFVSMTGKKSIWIGYFMLLLIAGSMVSQSCQLLIQADWISGGYPLWDSSTLVSESSVAGQLLYALIGYESTPTKIQVVCYLSSWALILLIISQRRYNFNVLFKRHEQ